MKCKDVTNYLDEYIDETASSDVMQAIVGHLEQCSSCRKTLEENRVIRSALRSLPVKDASGDFEARVFSAVRREYGTDRHGTGRKLPGNRFITGFATAMAASLALWFASTLYTPEPGEQAVHLVNLAVNQTRTLKLVFDAPVALSDVTLRVELPANIELEGYNNQKMLVWQTNLSKGSNVLALPVIATGRGQGSLVAQIEYGDKTKQFHITLNTDDSGAQYIQTVKFTSA